MKNNGIKYEEIVINYLKSLENSNLWNIRFSNNVEDFLGIDIIAINKKNEKYFKLFQVKINNKKRIKNKYLSKSQNFYYINNVDEDIIINKLIRYEPRIWKIINNPFIKNNNEREKMTKTELVKILKLNFTDKFGNINISNLDFGDFNRDIILDKIKIKGSICLKK